MARFEEISALLQRGKAKDLAALVTEELAAGVNPKDILNEGLIAGMGIVGTKFKNNEIFVPEVLIAARAMNAALAILKPAGGFGRGADWHGGHLHGQGRFARHRQKPRQDDD